MYCTDWGKMTNLFVVFTCWQFVAAAVAFAGSYCYRVYYDCFGSFAARVVADFAHAPDG